jgi:hypothetical protein
MGGLVDGTRMRRHLLAWFVVGSLMGAFVQWSQVRELGDGDVAALVSVGATSDARRYFEDELGSVPMVPGAGHDGQSSYIVARDPWATGDAWRYLDHPGYRYRRMFYPTVAGGLGLLGPRATVYGLALIALVGMGLAAGALADLARRYGTGSWTVLGVIANPGLWLSVKLLTPDALALGLALTAVALWTRDRRGPAVAFLATAALTKDAYLLFALGLAGWAWSEQSVREKLLLILGALTPLTLWGAWVSVRLGEGFAPRGNLSFPLAGLIDSVRGWPSSGDMFLSVFTILSLLTAGLAALLSRNRLLAWLSWPWVVLGLISSEWVWNLGNNSARAFAPALVVGALALSVALQHRIALRSFRVGVSENP